MYGPAGARGRVAVVLEDDDPQEEVDTSPSAMEGEPLGFGTPLMGRTTVTRSPEGMASPGYNRW